ncbi:MAG: 3'-5' exonuclease [Flavobacteriales bacterium]|nr:3'-5' exonuclease [Flavobacteriales bacterium]
MDVETTHGDPLVGRVIEVAVLVHDGSGIRERWHSLVDPGRAVPAFVQMLTGITTEMVRGAPTFKELVPVIRDLTQGRIIVAHNARFDMTVLSMEFGRCKRTFERSTLCTERLSHQLLPGLSHYNLTSLCRHLGVPISGQHRALNDAEATLGLLALLLDAHGRDRVERAIQVWPMDRCA